MTRMESILMLEDSLKNVVNWKMKAALELALEALWEQEARSTRNKPTDEAENMLLSELDLSCRASNCLKYAKMVRVSDVLKLSYSEFSWIRNSGILTRGEIIAALEKNGFNCEHLKETQLVMLPLPASTELNKLRFPGETNSYLRAAGMETVADLLGIDKWSLWRMKNVNTRKGNGIINTLEMYGFNCEHLKPRRRQRY